MKVVHRSRRVARPVDEARVSVVFESPPQGSEGSWEASAGTSTEEDAYSGIFDGFCSVVVSLFKHLSSDKIAYTLSRMSAEALDGSRRDALQQRRYAIFVDLIVLGRVFGSTVLLIAVQSHFVQRWGLLLASFLLYDVLIAHAAHLFDSSVGSAGEGKRQSHRRSLTIALTNVITCVVLFAVLFGVTGDLGWSDALAVSWSNMTTAGIAPLPPQLASVRAIALTQVAVSIGMFTVVVGTVLTGFQREAVKVS